MLAARLNLKDRSFGVEEVEVPEPGPGQVRIKVAAAGICLSDVHLIDGSLTPKFNPHEKVTLGHEVSGVIDRVGPEVPGWQTGQRVLLQAGEACGRCSHCLRLEAPCLKVRTRGVDYDGGWAEYALASHRTLVAIPDELPFEQAAIIPDALSTPWAAITSTARVQPATAVGVWGVGGLGAHTVQLLRLVGAAPVIGVDPLPAARERALDFGADLVLDSAASDVREQVLAATGGLGLKTAFDMAGVAAVRDQAQQCLGLHGQLVLVGLTPAPLTITQSVRLSYLRQAILGHYGSEPYHVLQLVELARSGRLDLSRSISGFLPLASAAEGVERLRTKADNPVRLILQP